MATNSTKTKTTNEMEKAVGRRKTAAARIRLMPGTGKITINGKPLEVYFNLISWQNKILSPLVLAGRDKQMDVTVKVSGGGTVSQCEAIRHGIARALIKWNLELKPAMRAAGYLTRDPRNKERKKPGLRKARRGHQWRKR